MSNPANAASKRAGLCASALVVSLLAALIPVSTARADGWPAGAGSLRAVASKAGITLPAVLPARVSKSNVKVLKQKLVTTTLNSKKKYRVSVRLTYDGGELFRCNLYIGSRKVLDGDCAEGYWMEFRLLRMSSKTTLIAAFQTTDEDYCHSSRIYRWDGKKLRRIASLPACSQVVKAGSGRIVVRRYSYNPRNSTNPPHRDTTYKYAGGKLRKA